ncbi:MAG: transcription elongation factor GreB [Pseudomonadota bacterium]
MSRYRPPAPASSPYITAAGQAQLQAELTHLWKVKRPEVTRKVSEAAALGDRSENAEYIYGKKQLREIDARIKYLSKRLDVLEVVDRAPNDKSRVFFGAWVTLADEAGDQRTLRIVGADEVDAGRDHMSIDAPLARACIGKQVGDEIVVRPQANQGVPRILDPNQTVSTQHYEVIKINYAAATES